ncbi:uncharacterized protein LOC108880343 [Lates calcarifer]|uniref:Uncharacterized protein LOC108880343 n=1 Tax=Lates calcarifer TaxID=8187 RepID=A0AAJ7PIY7_LATCA|nr:uncharacterized protein LOC108880343 [Lates calcarifer]
MERHFQRRWMQTVTRLNDEHFACNLTKVLGKRRYLYSPACNSSELDCISSLPSQPAFPESGPSKSAPEPGGPNMWEPVSMSADFSHTEEAFSPQMKASCRLKSDVEACMSQSTEATESSWTLKTLHQVTFSSKYLDPCTNQGYETAGCRYLYAPPSDISGFVDEGYPPYIQIHLDKEEPEISSLESDEKLSETSSCAAAVSKQTPCVDIALVNEEDKFNMLNLKRTQI